MVRAGAAGRQARFPRVRAWRKGQSCMAHFSLQFGRAQHGVVHKERPSVYGLCKRQDDKIAVVRVGDGAPYAFYLPGGAVESGESDPEALIRCFDRETGLTVWPIRQMGRAGQFAVTDTGPVNALCAFFEVELTATDGAPGDGGYRLIWMSAADALLKMRHDSHAWCILQWDRENRRYDAVSDRDRGA
jgi:8-oxo-dGTP diphosphatase